MAGAGAAERIPSQELFTLGGRKYAVCLTNTKQQTDLVLLRGDSAGRYAILKRLRSAEVDAANAIMAVP